MHLLAPASADDRQLVGFARFGLGRARCRERLKYGIEPGARQCVLGLYEGAT
jgi:hypothetical protein